ncbi:unnamed protein product [Phytophthora fragariaefolia]|uniref:Unnamed protein product n=1 Tax=Phytophthora fragariaefolia TaxID=1490495 RepID=A0A9W6YMY3_9STRA|nr:unnamed protein product [Phytophthora fragariaefolia]
MQILRALIVAIAGAMCHAGSPNLHLLGSDPTNGNKNCDFSKVNQVEQTASSLDSSDSDACPDECSLDNKPVKDEAGVEYLNDCLLRLALCTHSSILAASDMSDVMTMFGSVEGTIGLEGSGSTEQVVIDIGILNMFGSRTRDRSTDDAVQQPQGTGILEVFGKIKRDRSTDGTAQQSLGSAVPKTLL